MNPRRLGRRAHWHERVFLWPIQWPQSLRCLFGEAERPGTSEPVGGLPLCPLWVDGFSVGEQCLNFLSVMFSSAQARTATCLPMSST